MRVGIYVTGFAHGPELRLSTGRVAALGGQKEVALTRRYNDRRQDSNGGAIAEGSAERG
jgi:hypothetical protein